MFSSCFGFYSALKTIDTQSQPEPDAIGPSPGNKPWQKPADPWWECDAGCRG